MTQSAQCLSNRSTKELEPGWKVEIFEIPPPLQQNKGAAISEQLHGAFLSRYLRFFRLSTSVKQCWSADLVVVGMLLTVGKWGVACTSEAAIFSGPYLLGSQVVHGVGGSRLVLWRTSADPCHTQIPMKGGCEDAR